MALKLDAQLDGMYLMPKVLMTSTMKSEPALPCTRPLISWGIPLSFLMPWPEGGSADGFLGSAGALSAACATPTVEALMTPTAPLATTLFKNCRLAKVFCGSGLGSCLGACFCSCFMGFLLVGCSKNGAGTMPTLHPTKITKNKPFAYTHLP